MSEREPKLLLEDIVESIDKIIAYTEGLSYDEFVMDEKTLDAVVRNFEIIGEAAVRLPETVKEKNTNVDWHQIRGFRNRLIHHYFGIDYEIIWDVINDTLPTFRSQINKILEDQF